MSELLTSLVGKNVRFERGGHESRVGKLLAVGDDFAVLLHEKEGIVYYALDHLKSITMDSKDTSDLLPEPPQNPDLPEQPVLLPKYIDSGTMVDVMRSPSMLYRWVQVNRGGHDSVQGVLSKVENDYILLISKNELVCMFTSHIKSFGYVPMEQQQQQENGQNNGQDNSKQDKQKNDKKK